MQIFLRRFPRTLMLRVLATVHDIAMGTLALLLAFVVRLDIDPIWADSGPHLTASFLFGIIVGGIGYTFGLNRGVWRYASLPDLIAILKVATVSVALFVVAHFLLARLESVPRSSLIVAWAFLVIFLGASRAIYRMYRNDRDRRRERRSNPTSRAKRVLLVGAGDNAELFLKVIADRGGAGLEVLGIIDERRRRTGRFIRGIPILGGIDELPRHVERYAKLGRRPEALVLTRARDEYEERASITDLIAAAAEHGLEMLKLPNMLEMREIGHDLEIRPIRLEDLLQRSTINLNLSKVGPMIKDKVVLITGAGGSIGSELTRQLAALGPARLVLVDANESLLYTIDNEMQRLGLNIPIQSRLCNVREKTSIERIMIEHRPALVFHAAALKHVPIVEEQPLEGIFTNVIGTRNVAEAAMLAGVTAMVMISTDKAVNPANAMGATKRMAEMFCQAMDIASDLHQTRFVTVRFGNVLGSAGSVVPLFEKQLKAGGPLTVTHPDIERFFMTIPEACALVIQAAAESLSGGQDRGRIFVLDMGTPVKIADLAKNMIRLSGLRPDIDISITYTGLRPGEKLYEELFDDREKLSATKNPDILVAFPRPVEGALIARIFDEMQKLLESHDETGAIRLLKSTVPEFVQNTDTGSDAAQGPSGGGAILPAL